MIYRPILQYHRSFSVCFITPFKTCPLLSTTPFDPSLYRFQGHGCQNREHPSAKRFPRGLSKHLIFISHLAFSHKSVEKPDSFHVSSGKNIPQLEWGTRNVGTHTLRACAVGGVGHLYTSLTGGKLNHFFWMQLMARRCQVPTWGLWSAVFGTTCHWGIPCQPKAEEVPIERDIFFLFPFKLQGCSFNSSGKKK